MVLDKYVCQMAYEGDIGAVKAWLAADPSRDVTDLSFWEGETHSTSNHSSLLTFAAAGRPSEAKCVLIRWLLEQGVDPCHYVEPAVTPLYLAAAGAGWERAVEVVSMLCEAAPLERQVASKMTPLRAAFIHGFGRNSKGNDFSPSDMLEMVKVLLRHGAPLDDYPGYTPPYTSQGQPCIRFSADDCLSAVERLPGFLDSHLAQNEAFVETKALIAGVRACGSSWTSYCRLPHKELLRLRSLILRGRARPRREPITARRVAAHRSITFLLCKLGDNGVVWKILEFWQATR